MRQQSKALTLTVFEMFLIKRLKAEFSGDSDGRTPNEDFAAQYGHLLLRPNECGTNRIAVNQRNARKLRASADSLWPDRTPKMAA
jgi:hypothetical protein